MPKLPVAKARDAQAWRRHATCAAFTRRVDWRKRSRPPGGGGLPIGQSTFPPPAGGRNLRPCRISTEKRHSVNHHIYVFISAQSKAGGILSVRTLPASVPTPPPAHLQLLAPAGPTRPPAHLHRQRTSAATQVTVWGAVAGGRRGAARRGGGHEEGAPGQWAASHPLGGGRRGRGGNVARQHPPPP